VAYIHQDHAFAHHEHFWIAVGLTRASYSVLDSAASILLFLLYACDRAMCNNIAHILGKK